ncbi:acyl carrier protein [Nitrospirillum sp. BR 11163]|uniref:acyl carrier protein n=1 Tax=Nitrospirillum sp. BR 11163 TaxID=3104323 RepID=UPI002AFF62D8|nr:acyl carrier protein [Nitrospirillum sp. BR 11163]MEA1671965.1 acyl carrier protein [Nitrospirillum sp. BR 11163]
MDDIPARIRRIVVRQLGVPEDALSNDMSFVDDLGADSLDAMEMVLAFEGEFGCPISDEAIRKMITVRDAASYIAANR